MKLKRVSFTSTTWDRPRNISALGGNQSSIYVGQVVQHTARAESAMVASLEFDGRSQQLLMRLVYAGEGAKKGQPFRRFTTNEAVQPGEECDVVGMFCDDRTIFYYDLEESDVATAPPAPAFDFERLERLVSDAIALQKAPNLLKQDDPPPAKPVQQGQQRR